MIGRLKKMQTRRSVIDKVIAEEEKKKAALKQKEQSDIKKKEYSSEKTASSSTTIKANHELRDVINFKQPVPEQNHI